MIRFLLTKLLLHLPLLLFPTSLHLISGIGLASDPRSPQGANEAVSHAAKSSSSALVGIVIICLGVAAAIIGFAVVLFKIWQKKKREEQHARLTKLFEEDDELEAELR